MRQMLYQLWLFACVAVLGCASAGCNVLGYAAQAVAGEEKINAVYVLPLRPTVVVAEKYSNPSVSAQDEEPLARFATEELRGQKGSPPMIDSGQVYALHQSMTHDQWQAMTTDAIA